jgi:hypothetical protein
MNSSHTLRKHGVAGSIVRCNKHLLAGCSRLVHELVHASSEEAELSHEAAVCASARGLAARWSGIVGPSLSIRRPPVHQNTEPTRWASGVAQIGYPILRFQAWRFHANQNGGQTYVA